MQIHESENIAIKSSVSFKKLCDSDKNYYSKFAIYDENIQIYSIFADMYEKYNTMQRTY